MWFFFVDIVGSSISKIPPEDQLKKIELIVRIIENFLTNHCASYKSFTGDGMLLVFSNYDDARELAILIHKEKNEYNKSLRRGPSINTGDFYEKELHVRIGIGAGNPQYFKDGVHAELAPWGINLVITKRIMDLANEDQILVSDSAYQVIRELPSSVEIKDEIKEMGDVFIKHQENGEKVFSLYRENEYGNMISLNSNLDISKILTTMKVNSKLRKPLLRFCKKRAENTIHSLYGIMSANGLELSNITTDILYEVLFKETKKYIAASFLPPGEFWNAHNCENPYNLLNYHAALIENLKFSEENDKRYRFLIMPKNRMKLDKANNYGSASNFMRWHKNNHVSLFLVDPIEYGNLFSTRPTLETDTGIGLCYDLCILQFGQLEQYVNERYKDQPVVKRKFWLSDATSESYQEGESLFEELKELANDNKLILVDMDFFNKL